LKKSSKEYPMHIAKRIAKQIRKHGKPSTCVSDYATGVGRK